MNVKEEQSLYENFLKTVKEKVPNKTVLVKRITELLNIDKDLVYRRLRGDVPFSFPEIALISKSLNISLDNMVGIESETSRPIQLKLIDYVHPTEKDYNMLEEYNEVVRSAKDIPNTELGESSNTLPLSFYLKYTYLSRFYLFKWNFQYHIPQQKKFHELTVPERLNDVFQKYTIYMEYFSISYYLWDPWIFKYLVNDIRYFFDIGLIKKEDINLIANDLLQLLGFVEDLCRTGCYKTGNKVYLFISDINLNTFHSYLDVSYAKISLFSSFFNNTSSSVDERIFFKTKNWIQSLLRTSTMITLSNEKQRIAFFYKQREIISQLLDKTEA
ncbi:MAG: hypothetical protein LBQ60_03825 [Bacteroidales bacterium]|jgi:hypothetical protein|nr:hypothetical protein [Bacteroidales bacterium]